MKLNFALVIALFICTFSFAQTDEEIGNDPELTKKAEEKAKNRPGTYPVTDNIFMLKGMGGNIAVHHGIDGVLMIDTQFENISESILEAIAKETDLPLEFVINTHAHGDHTGGNKNFKRKGATILAHENTRDIMLSKMYKTAEQQALADLEKSIDEAKGISGSGEKLAAMEETKEELMIRIREQAQENMEIDYEQLPAISFQDDMLFHYNDEEIKLFHIPNAHTKGDIMVYFPKSNVIHTGDAFVNGMYPFIDFENGGSYEGYQRGLTTIMNRANDETVIIPGHGNLANRADVIEMRRMMKIFYDKVVVEYMMNKTEDQVAEMRNFSELFDEKGYGDGLITTERFLRSVYKAVALEKGRERDKNKRQTELLKKNQERAKKMDEGRQ